MNIRVVPCVTRILERAGCWFQNRPSKLAMGLSTRGRILAAMMGIKHDHPLQAQNIVSDVSDPKRILNEEQLMTFRWIVNRVYGILHQNAVGGSGKMFCVIVAIAHRLLNDPNMRVVFTTRANSALKRLVKEVVSVLKDIEAMVILSAPAKAEYADDFAPFRKHLVVAAAEELLGEMSERPDNSNLDRDDMDSLTQYIGDCGERPRKSKERIALAVMNRQKRALPRVIFATLAMLEDLPTVTRNTTVMVVDEAGQGAVDQSISLLCDMPMIEQIVFTGDERQLLNYVQDVPEMVRDFGTEFLLTYLPKLSDKEIQRVTLTKTYRFHPIIATCLAATGYGDRLVPVVGREDRAMVTKASLSFLQPECPILLLYQDEEDTKASDNYSRYNEPQASTAFSILVEMLHRLPESAEVVVICLYTEEKNRLRGKLRGHGIRNVVVKSVDGFQGDEADLLYVLTTRSAEGSADDSAFDFIKNDRRATTALSRARHGIVVHGNLKTMSFGKAWSDFMVEALRHTSVVSSYEYLNAIREERHPATLTLPSWAVGGKESGFNVRSSATEVTPSNASMTPVPPGTSQSPLPTASSSHESPLPQSSGTLETENETMR